MNNLDFIDREITFTLMQENRIKTIIESTPNDRELRAQKDALTIELKVVKECLSHFQQIKEELEQENFDLKQKLNTEEDCCVMLEKKVKKQVEIIKSLCKALEEKEIDLSYLIFSYLTPEEWLYCKELLDYE